MVDYQVNGDYRINILRISAQLREGVPQGCQIDDCRNAGKILHENSRRFEGDLMLHRCRRVPGCQIPHAVFGDCGTVNLPHHRLQKDLYGYGNRGKVDLESSCQVFQSKDGNLAQLGGDAVSYAERIFKGHIVHGHNITKKSAVDSISRK